MTDREKSIEYIQTRIEGLERAIEQNQADYNRGPRMGHVRDWKILKVKIIRQRQELEAFYKQLRIFEAA